MGNEDPKNDELGATITEPEAGNELGNALGSPEGIRLPETKNDDDGAMIEPENGKLEIGKLEAIPDPEAGGTGSDADGAMLKLPLAPPLGKPLTLGKTGADPEALPEGIGTLPLGIGTLPLGIGTLPLGIGILPLAGMLPERGGSEDADGRFDRGAEEPAFDDAGTELGMKELLTGNELDEFIGNGGELELG